MLKGLQTLLESTNLSLYSSSVKTGEVGSAGTYQKSVNVNPAKVGSSEGVKKTNAIMPDVVKQGEKAKKLTEDLIQKYLKVVLESRSISDQDSSFKNQTFDGKNAMIKFDQTGTSQPIKVNLKSNKSK